MWNRFMRALGAILIAAATLTGTAASAQTETRTAAHADWSVFESGSGNAKVCWIVTQPTASEARRDGRAVQVRRDPIYLMVAVRPADGVANEVSFLSGYPFKSGSKVQIVIGAGSFELFTEGENAWLTSSEEDDAVVAAMRRGLEAVAKGISSRGTETKDTFSLRGFTAALEQARDICS